MPVPHRNVPPTILSLRQRRNGYGKGGERKEHEEQYKDPLWKVHLRRPRNVQHCVHICPAQRGTGYMYPKPYHTENACLQSQNPAAVEGGEL